MNIFKSIRDRLAGVYESAPIVLMDEADARQWVADHPECSRCSQAIKPDGDSYTLVNNSVTGIEAYHMKCPI